jgi:hypothetical protein
MKCLKECQGVIDIYCNGPCLPELSETMMGEWRSVYETAQVIYGVKRFNAFLGKLCCVRFIY